MPDRKPFRTTRPLANLRQGRSDWYRIKASAGTGSPALLHIYDEIGYFGVTAADLIRDLAEIKGDLEVHLNSPGGEVFDGIAIYNALLPREPAVVVDSLAASITSVIAMAAGKGKLAIAKNASMMIHDGFGMAIGNARDMQEMAALLDKTSDNIASIYADRTGQPAAQWREAMLAETWYVGQEAVDAGLADFVQGAESADAPEPGGWDLSVFSRAPSSPRNAEKYSADDRKAMASKGHAMPDGSYPIADAEDLDNAIRAVGRGNADHDAIRRHIIKRADALGLSSKIPDNWNADGSLGGQDASNHAEPMPAWLTKALTVKEAASR